MSIIRISISLRYVCSGDRIVPGDPIIRSTFVFRIKSTVWTIIKIYRVSNFLLLMSVENSDRLKSNRLSFTKRCTTVLRACQNIKIHNYRSAANAKVLLVFPGSDKKRREYRETRREQQYKGVPNYNPCLEKTSPEKNQFMKQVLV